MPDVQYLIHCVVSFFIFKLKIDFYKLFISLINFTAEPFSQIKFFFLTLGHLNVSHQLIIFYQMSFAVNAYTTAFNLWILLVMFFQLVIHQLLFP